MKLTFPHVLSYLVAGLTWLAALNPVTVAAVFGPKAGALTVPLIALAGAVLVFIHDISPVKVAAANVVKLLVLTAFVMPVLMTMSACATLTAPSSQPFIVAAVDVAVATAEAKGVSAADINRIAKIALAADAGTPASLATLAPLVNAQLAKLNLPAADLAAANILEIALTAAIQAKIGNSPNVAQAQAAVADVLNAVIAASGG